jgi:hypothetical protein
MRSTGTVRPARLSSSSNPRKMVCASDDQTDDETLVVQVPLRSFCWMRRSTLL